MVYDAIIIGAGPVGAMTARLISEKGFKTLLCEEHSSIGSPLHCTGKLTTHAFQDFNLPIETILNSVSAAKFYSPKGIEFSIRKGSIDSYILDRKMLDQKLVEIACSSGCELSLQTRVQDVHIDSDMINLKVKRIGISGYLKSRLIINTEGARPTLLRKVGLEGPNQILSGLQYEVTGVDIHSQDCVELYFGKNIAPGFFAWVVPLNMNVARVGLAIDNKSSSFSAQYYLRKFLNQIVRHAKRRNVKIENTYSGTIPISGPIKRSYTDRMLAVGDSAGQIKVTSGGGIYFGLKCAEIACKIANQCLEKDTLGGTHLKQYETIWKKTIGRELKTTLFVRKIMNSLTDEELDQMFLILNDKKIKNIVEKHGDTAYQSRVLRSILPDFLNASLKKKGGLFFLAKLLFKGLTSTLP
ncbi:NAD(P)/FAD-dependent oxidoreductase [Candidatus Bathyarchaeota archaeon]|nr:NAD(P)/FAD-dependent oxidoreductase [Candidatus Bathyarchaeota archaeon]